MSRREHRRLLPALQWSMARCVTCGSQLHPERAARYDHCTRPECRRRNAKALRLQAVGVNKAADQYKVVDEGAPVQAPGDDAIRRVDFGDRRGRAPTRARPGGHPAPPARQWTDAQQDLAVVWNAGGMRPDQIAGKLGLGTQVVIQMLLAAKR
jgi:hypothetical protein